jgi:2-polyprenyl-6-methoxyphenol hydroxylase-like FAD-dependent oxidoreductase
VERIIIEEIEKLQGKVAWQTELISYEQLGDQVVAQVKDHTNGETKEICAKYIVGADGCHSKVRKQNPTWTYEGHSIKSQFALADLVLEGPDIARIRNRQVVFYHSRGKDLLSQYDILKASLSFSLHRWLYFDPFTTSWHRRSDHFAYGGECGLL